MQEYHKHAHADSIARIQKLVVSMPEVDEHVTLTVEYFDKRTLTQSYAGPSATISSSLVHAAAQRLLVGCAIAVNLVFDHWKEDVALKVWVNWKVVFF